MQEESINTKNKTKIKTDDYNHCDCSLNCQNRCDHICCQTRAEMMQELQRQAFADAQEKYNNWLQKIVLGEIPPICSECQNFIKQNNKQNEQVELEHKHFHKGLHRVKRQRRN